MSDQKTILLVEDEAILSLIKKLQLEKEGYAVISVHTGEMALDIFCSARNQIDLILMDIDLGEGIDGTETARKILEKHDLPLIFLSSHTEKEFVDKTESILNYGYVVKNSSFTVLDASIKMAFKLFLSKQELQRQLDETQSLYLQEKNLNKTSAG